MPIDPAIATAADYADALIVARRAKKTLILLMMLMLVAQVAVFSVVKFSGLIPESAIAPVSEATTQVVAGQVASGHAGDWKSLLMYGSSLSLHVGLVCAVLLPFALLLIALVMLVGRLIGMAPVVSAFVWSLVVLALMFPWQTMLSVQPMPNSQMVLPGVLYTWDEIALRAKSTPTELQPQILYWARFYGWPVITLILLLRIQLKSGRGLRMAMGETGDPQSTYTQTTPVPPN
jgi:hypothetical protein